MKKIFLIVFIGYWAVLGSGKAQVLSGNLGTSWLKISPSTRDAGMGDSALAVPDAYDEADINPAGLGLIGGTNLSLSQNFYAQGISAQHLIFTQSAADGDGFSIGANYINFGSISTFNVTGNVLTSTGSYSPVGLNLYAAYGMDLGDGLRAGLTGHFIYDNIQQNFPDKTVALDAGLFYHLPNRPFSFSAVMTNLGWNIDNATLPLQVKAGGAYQLFGSENAEHFLTLSGEVDTFLNDGNYAQLGLGAEYWYKNLIGLRAGYQFSNIGDLTGLTGLSLGAGIRYGNWQLDYALITLGELGVANQISLSVDLGGDAKPTATSTMSPTAVITPAPVPAENLSAQKWWGEPFDAQTAYEKLIHKIVPALVNQHQLVLLGDHRRLFFGEAMKQGVNRNLYISMVSGYYTAVGENLVRSGYPKEAEVYFNLARYYQDPKLDIFKQPEIWEKVPGN